MAQISSYPSLVPQLGDNVLGSNTVDTAGNPVIGNPTVQYSISSVKSVVDQQYIQQFSQGSAAATQGPTALNTAHIIEFGAVNATSPNVQLNVAGVVTFVSRGTYQVELVYYIGNVAAENNVVTLFRTLQDITQIGGAPLQLGQTTVEGFKSNSNTATRRVVISYTVNITTPNTTHTQQMFRDGNGINSGVLKQITLNNTTSPVASAQVTISKLI